MEILFLCTGPWDAQVVPQKKDFSGEEDLGLTVWRWSRVIRKVEYAAAICSGVCHSLQWFVEVMFVSL